MTTETDFLSAIHAAPEDATTKLVFADWLEERDDLRAGLLRRTVRFQELTGDAAECYERGGVLPLLDGRFAHWVTPLTAWGNIFLAERGLLCLAVESQLDQEPWEADPAWDWVTELVVGSGTPRDEGRTREELRCAIHLAQMLDRPDLGVRLVVDAGPRWEVRNIESLRWVTALDLRGMPWGTEPFEQLLWRGGMPRLREVRSAWFGRETLQRLADATPDVPLRVLEFGVSREVPRPEFEWLASSEACAGLEELTFHGEQPLDAADLATLARAPWFPQLCRLELPLANIRAAGMAPLAATGPLTRLEVLRLRGDGLDAGAVRALVDGPARRSLRTLELASPDLDADAVRVLVECPHLRELCELSLWPDLRLVTNQAVDTDDARVLVKFDADEVLRLLASAPWPRLEALVLGLEGVTRQGMLAFLDGDLLPRLSYLSLRNNGRLQLHLEDLADSPAVAELLGLNLRGAPLDDREVAALLGSRYLARRCTLRIWAPNLVLDRKAEAALRQRYFFLELNGS
jgi:uncharacterized protein (TIGR02996 family)